MPPGLGDVTSAAHDLVADGDLAAARELLDEVLHTADPSPAHASPELTDAAGLQARILLALGDPDAAREWAAFAYAACTRLHGASDPRTVNAAATLAAVLHRVGSNPRAARLYRDVIIELTAMEGPESLRVLAAHADLATVEYATGQCEVARTRLTDAWELHREVYGDGHPSGIKMLARLAGMERDCGRSADARRHFALAQELCRQRLGPHDPLAYQVDALAGATADPEHVCATPSAEDERLAEAETAPEAVRPAEAVDPETDYWAAPRHPLPNGPALDPDPTPPRVPPPREPAYGESVEHPYPSLIEQPGDEPHDRWWRPDETVQPYDPVRTGEEDHPAAGSAPPYDPGPPYGTVTPPWYRPSHPAQVAGVYPMPNLPERRPSDRLPAPVYHPPRRPDRRMLPIGAVGVLVVLLGAAAVIAGFWLTGDPAADPAAPPRTSGGSASRPPSPGPTSPPSSAPPASPGAPPTAVTLRDNADSVTLNWAYPRGAEGPVVIAGSRQGQRPQVFQELPAGSKAFTVYGLNKDLDYCFTVGVAYSADLVGTARPVCTNRTRD